MFFASLVDSLPVYVCYLFVYFLYEKLKIEDINKVATITKEQSQTLRIKNELKYLQIKKSGIKNYLYYLQNDGVTIYGKTGQ